MLTGLSALKLDLALLALELLQRESEVPAEGELRDLVEELRGRFGAVPSPGDVGLATLARMSGLGEATLHDCERSIRAKVARRLIDSGRLPPRLAGRICGLIDSDPTQPELF